MKIYVEVRTNKRKTVVLERKPCEFQVDLRASPHENKANHELIDVIADFFHVARERVRICSGETYKKKVLEIL